MSLNIEAEPVVSRSPSLTRIEPASFRGVDCMVLAERYVAYLRSRDQEQPKDDPDVIVTVAAASSENV